MRAIWIAVLVVACGKASDDKPAGGGAASGSAAAADPVVDAWRAAKLVPSALTPASVAFGKDCQSGTIEGLDVLLCRYGSAVDAKAAESPGYGWVGQATGASQAHGTTLIVLADRRKVDPSGRTINRLMKLAPK
jgi:hypothetical protein